jgi:hypothetical protein
MPNTLPLLKRPIIYLPLVLLFVLAVGVNLFSFINKDKLTSQNNTAVTPTPTPGPIKSISSGKQIYNVSHGSAVKGPKIQQVTIDPQTPAPKEKQTVTLVIKNDSPLTEAVVYIQTDNRELSFPLKLIEGNTQNGTWQGTWGISDTYNYTYYLRFNLKSPTGDYNSGIRLR